MLNKTFYWISKNRDPVWYSRDYQYGTLRSLYQTEEIVTGLSSPKAKTSGQNNHDDGEELEISPKSNEHHVFNSKKENHEKTTKKKRNTEDIQFRRYSTTSR